VRPNQDPTPNTLQEELARLPGLLGTASIAPVAYDTAWVARVGRPEAPGRPAFPEAIAWLLRHQHGDGTWGGRIAHHQDRVVSTLAGMLALAQWREVSDAAEDYTDRLHAAGWGLAGQVAALGRDACGLPGFARRAAALIAEARWRRLVLPVPGLDSLAGRNLPAGMDAGDSGAPAAARRLLQDAGCQTARTHLEEITARSQGAAAPELDATDPFERAWVLDQVALAWPDAGRSGAWNGALGGLRECLAGATDRARASIAFRVLTWAGQAPDPALLRRLEAGPEGSQEAPHGRFASVGGQVHFLAALRAAPPFEGREAAIRKTIGALAATATTDHFWVDGRHASPYYATARAVTALGPGLSLTDEAVAWIQQTQRPDGSWGFFESSTVEETAYGVQALACHERAGGEVNADAIERGASWMLAHRPRQPADHEPLWVGPTLYTPTTVVQASVLSALTLARR
jgi:halimadienyl-diphosphate synthase